MTCLLGSKGCTRLKPWAMVCSRFAAKSDGTRQTILSRSFAAIMGQAFFGSSSLAITTFNPRFRAV